MLVWLVSFAVFYFALHYVSQMVLQIRYPALYKALDADTRHEFANRVNSMVNAILTSTLSIYALLFSQWNSPDRFVPD